MVRKVRVLEDSKVSPHLKCRQSICVLVKLMFSLFKFLPVWRICHSLAE